MEPAFFYIAILLSVLSISSGPDKALCRDDIKSTRSLDLLIKDYTFKSYGKSYFRTAELQVVKLPGNLSDIRVDIARYRCGSLKRYGARIREFHLGVGVTVQPCVERVLMIRQVLGFNWSSMFYSNYDLSGYQLVSPVLGLMAYNAGKDPFQVGVHAGSENPIMVNFSSIARIDQKLGGIVPLCASFGGNRQLAIMGSAGQSLCRVPGHGHFGLVAELPSVQMRRRVSRWKVVVGSSIGALLGLFLLSLLMMAMLVKAKKKSRREEMERRAYEEEALQVSMVGHVRAPMAAGTRTMPVIERRYSAPYR
ncbi:hypothetical protein SAY86_001544 [Trapa natans]|uniref:Uncharacterized protein n=1 Tax=Trapa natans TaxID=22666 RepID=A0AAN7RMI0_TRANT|nr:hypothetical protein SAY86_001544 [Trapa natans]